MEALIVEFHEDGTVSENFDKLTCAKCGESLELYEVYEGKFIIVCSHTAENPEPSEAGHTSLKLKT